MNLHNPNFIRDNNDLILFGLRKQCANCPTNQKDACMAVKKEADVNQSLVWIPKCQYDKLRKLSDSVTAKRRTEL